MSQKIQNFDFQKSRHILLAFLMTSFLFFFFLPAVVKATGPTLIYGTITEDQIWTKDNSPYIISWQENGLILHAKLTIQAGTVIKIYGNKWWNQYYGIKVEGNQGGSLQILGTADEPVIFTSYFDDSYYGDTDGFEGLFAEPGDYRGITFINDNNSLVKNVEFNYCGSSWYGNEGCLILDNSEVLLEDIKIKKSLLSGVLVKNNSKADIENLEASENKGEVLQLNDKSRIVINNSNLHHNHGSYLMTMSAAGDLNGVNNNFYDNDNELIKISQYQIDNEATWRNFGLPYLAMGEIKIGPTGKLNVEPGVLVRFDFYYSRLLNQGELNINGLAGQEVVFNSSSDQPEIYGNYWGGIVFDSGSTGNVNYLKIKQAGAYYTNFTGIFYATVEYNSLRVTDSAPQINHLIIEKSIGYGLNTTGAASPIIENCVIKDTAMWGVWSESSEIVTLKNCSFENNNQGAIANLSPTVIDARYNWWGDNSGPMHENNPDGTGGLIYGNVLFDPWIGKSQDLDPVILVPGIMGSWNLTGKWELDPIMHTYDNLWEALKRAGYEEGKNLFAFPYQWRVSNELTAYDLMQKIDEAQQISGKNKVDIIGHSMGGLIARYYIENEFYKQDNDGNDNIDIDQVIFLGTPHKGATKSYLMWEGGEVGIEFPSDWLMERIFSVEADFNGYGSVYQYVRGLPMTSVKELLSIYDYLRDKDSGIIREYPYNYPRNYFLEELNEQSKLDKMNQVRGLNIIGKIGNESTINILRVVEDRGADGEWEYGYPEKFNNVFFGGDHGLEYSEGDQSVPNRSNNQFYNWQNVELNYGHKDIVTEAQKNIIKELTGVEPIEFVRLNQFQKFFIVRIFSPADFQVIDPQGRIIGKDFVNNAVINEIPDAFYSGFENTAEFVVIPNPLDGEYKIITQGTEDGIFDLSTSIIDDNYAVDKFVDDIPVELNQQDIFVSNINTSDEEPILDLEPEDQTPPTINIISPEPKQYLHSEILTLDYAVTDDESGVYEQTVYLDEIKYDLAIIDLFYQELEMHEFAVSAKDRMGNSATITVEFEIIANLNSLYSDINRTYSLGWITNSLVKDKFLQIVNAAKSWYNLYQQYKVNKPVLAATVKQKLLAKLSELQNKLNQYQSAGYITQEGNNLLYKQIEFIIKNL